MRYIGWSCIVIGIFLFMKPVFLGKWERSVNRKKLKAQEKVESKEEY